MGSVKPPAVLRRWLSPLQEEDWHEARTYSECLHELVPRSSVRPDVRNLGLAWAGHDGPGYDVQSSQERQRASLDTRNSSLRSNSSHSHSNSHRRRCCRLMVVLPSYAAAVSRRDCLLVNIFGRSGVGEFESETVLVSYAHLSRKPQSSIVTYESSSWAHHLREALGSR
jgi:hypothetical protein